MTPWGRAEDAVKGAEEAIDFIAMTPGRYPSHEEETQIRCRYIEKAITDAVRDARERWEKKDEPFKIGDNGHAPHH